MTVRVALTEDRHESEDIALEAEPLTVCLDQSFTRELRRTVERRLNRERGGFARGKLRRVPVDRSRRREDDTRHAVLAHRLEHVERGNGVLIEIPARVFGSEPDVGVRRQVEHGLAASHSGAQRVGVERVGFDQRGAWMTQRVLDERALPRREVVEDDDVIADLEQPIDEITADEAGAARYETAHYRSAHRVTAVRPRRRSIGRTGVTIRCTRRSKSGWKSLPAGRPSGQGPQ